MRKVLWPCSVFLAVCLLSVPTLAHHPFSAMFDSLRAGTIRGVVTKITWTMPHPYIYLDVRDERGQTANWFVEGSNVRILENAGWSAATVKPGDTISVCGYLGKPNVSPEGYPPGVVSERALSGVLVTLSDGRNLPLISMDRMSCP